MTAARFVLCKATSTGEGQVRPGRAEVALRISRTA